MLASPGFRIVAVIDHEASPAWASLGDPLVVIPGRPMVGLKVKTLAVVEGKKLGDGLVLAATRYKLDDLRVASLCLLYHVVIYLDEVDYLLEAVNG